LAWLRGSWPRQKRSEPEFAFSATFSSRGSGLLSWPSNRNQEIEGNATSEETRMSQLPTLTAEGIQGHYPPRRLPHHHQVNQNAIGHWPLAWLGQNCAP